MFSKSRLMTIGLAVVAVILLKKAATKDPSGLAGKAWN